MVGGKPWYKLSLVFGEIELDRETCQKKIPFLKVVEVEGCITTQTCYCANNLISDSTIVHTSYK
jgi:hypothetical protein